MSSSRDPTGRMRCTAASQWACPSAANKERGAFTLRHHQFSPQRPLAARARSVCTISGPNQNQREEEGMRMTDHAVVIAGGGPTGMMLAAELTLAGTEVVIVERRASFKLESSRSRGLHSRTIEVLDQRGIADRFLAEGQAVQVQAFAGVPLDISDFPTRHNYGLALLQSHFERILAGWVSELGVRIVREREVTGLAQDDAGVDIELSDGQSLRADYLVGCDGGRSVIRKAAGIEFAGWDPTTSWLIAEVEMVEEPEFGLRGGGGIGPAEDGRVGITLTEPTLEHTSEPTLQDVREALIAVDGTDYGVHSPTWISRFTDMTRQAASYRKGRVLLAGDAAHVHSPQGGQGLNIGVQDAVNLGWKLAQVINGTSPDSLLDTYHAERHPVAARVLQNTMAQRALGGTDERTNALLGTVTELLSMDEPRKRFAGMMSGLEVHYELGEGHPLLGRRMPDLDLMTADGPLRVFDLLHGAVPVLINFAKPGGLDVTPWAHRVQLINADFVGRWELPVLGEVTAPTAVLIRPDGYVAWVGDNTDTGLGDALTTWFGTP
ncbi:MAG TPA: FAD-dependent monooxygenase [Acidimicrobiales bacterium]|nr:FAD-dependent monooxygenase [Acidimicrobiales bacterium]